MYSTFGAAMRPQPPTLEQQARARIQASTALSEYEALIFGHFEQSEELWQWLLDAEEDEIEIWALSECY